MTLCTSARIAGEYVMMKCMLNQRDPVEHVFHALGDPTAAQDRRTPEQRAGDRQRAGAAACDLAARRRPAPARARGERARLLGEGGPRAELQRAAGRDAGGRAAGSRSERTEWERRLDRLGEYLAENP